MVRPPPQGSDLGFARGAWQGKVDRKRGVASLSGPGGDEEIQLKCRPAERLR
jgi:hypothetical protein